MKCKPKERLGEGCWGYTLKVGEHVDGILELRTESISSKEKKKKRIHLGGNIKLSLGIQLALKQCQG